MHTNVRTYVQTCWPQYGGSELEMGGQIGGCCNGSIEFKYETC